MTLTLTLTLTLSLTLTTKYTQVSDTVTPDVGKLRANLKELEARLGCKTSLEVVTRS